MPPSSRYDETVAMKNRQQMQSKPWSLITRGDLKIMVRSIRDDNLGLDIHMFLPEFNLESHIQEATHNMYTYNN